MSDKIARLTEELKAHLEKANAIAVKADDEGRDFTDEERAEVTESMRKAQEVKKALDTAKADSNVRAAIQDLGDAVGLIDGQAEAKDRRAQAEQDGYRSGTASIGETFITSEQYQDLLKSAPNGMFAKDMRVQSRPVGYKELVTGASPTSGGAFRTEDYRGVLVGPEQFFRPLTLRQLVTGGTTTSDQIEYTRITGWNNRAAPVPEAVTSAPVGSGEPAVTPTQAGVKPESGFSTVRVTTPVRTIAHWIPATKRALSDAAQVRTLIDSFLETGLEEELEDQMIAGDGIGENFEGLASVSGTQTQPAVPDPAGKPAGFGKLLAVRRAKTKIRTVGRSVANAVVIHPNDLESLDEISDNQGRFYGDGPFGANLAQRLWNLPVVESEAAIPGTPWVGDFRKAILWDRQQASLTVTDSHADFFVRNLVAILAEMRAAFGIIQPSAFCKVTL
ncbi:phage major capsid protein [Amycolatopsis anabasis]|uniref:phage major capsid protein n=1 Tax=Amycolatopsis anabasis TaxID=1840409 RepID=UPI00131CA022|nr:phage major capsid protein [Amycolatopsis anabasis]